MTEKIARMKEIEEKRDEYTKDMLIKYMKE